MFRLGRLTVSLRQALGSRHTGSLSLATTCMLSRDLASLEWHRELPPKLLAGSEVLVLFLFSEASGRWEGFTTALQLCPLD